jgi:2-methylcitrate dehydratase PrpD
VRRADVIALRDKVRATRDDSIAEDAVKIRVTTNDGRTLELFVEHAIGSTRASDERRRPAREVRSLVEPVLGAARADNQPMRSIACPACAMSPSWWR